MDLQQTEGSSSIVEPDLEPEALNSVTQLDAFIDQAGSVESPPSIEPDIGVVVPGEQTASIQEQGKSIKIDTANQSQRKEDKKHDYDTLESSGEVTMGQSPTEDQATDESKVDAKGPKDANKESEASGGSQWSSYFKRAVANMESTLDRVLQEGSTVDLGLDSGLPRREEVEIKRPDSRASYRMTMQERLAKAVGRNSGEMTRESATSSPELSTDTEVFDKDAATVAAAQGQEPEVVRHEPKSIAMPQPPETAEPSLDLSLKLIDNLSQVVSLLDLPQEELSVLKQSLEGLHKDQQAQSTRIASEKKHYQDTIASLNERLKMLSRQEADRAGAFKQKATGGLEKKLAERDQQIALLFDEGQAMAKKELVHMTTIKKLRTRERELDKNLELATLRCNELETRAAGLQSRADAAANVVKIEAENTALKSRLEMKDAEIKELRDKRDEELASRLSEQMQALEKKNQVLESALNQAQVDLSLAKKQAEVESRELQAELEKAQRNNSKKTAELQDEIKTLEAKVEHFRSMTEEARSGDASQSSDPAGRRESVTQASLTQQMENLRIQHAISADNWHGIEASLLAKISGLELELEHRRKQASQAKDRLKSVTEALRDKTDEYEVLVERVQSMESDRSKVAMELADLRTQLFDTNKRISALEGEKTTLVQRLAEAEANANDLTIKLKEKDEVLEQQQKAQQHKVRQQQLSPDMEIDEPMPLLSAPDSPTLSYRHASESFDPDESFNSRLRGLDSASVNSVSTAGPSVHFVGKLSATIRRLQSELSSVREDLSEVSRSRDEATAKLLELIGHNQELERTNSRISELESKIRLLETREHTTLEMLGEKSERVAELEADVEDMREMYQRQISQLADQLAAKS